MSRLLLVVALTAAVSACGDPRAPLYVSTKPAVADVVGRYELDDGWSVLPDETGATVDASRPSGLLLHDDGAFAAVSVPGREETTASAGPPLVTASGRWSIRQTGSVDRGNGLEPLWSVVFDSEPPLAPASILDPAPPHRLVVVLGDPDEGLGLALRRVD